MDRLNFRIRSWVVGANTASLNESGGEAGRIYLVAELTVDKAGLSILLKRTIYSQLMHKK